MGQKIVVGPVGNGLRNDLEPFYIDNDSFPALTNAYQWRGRVKRKRGTSLLTRLNRYFASTNTSYTSTSTITLAAITGAGNLVSGFSLQTNASIVPGTVVITAPGPIVYTDQGDGTFLPSGTINYATGAIAIVAQAGNAVSAVFKYYPNLPVMGLRDLTLSVNDFPGTLAFDTTYAYNILTTTPYKNYDVSFYKNPTTGTYSGYTEKTNITPVTWNGQDYQQFWTVNYQGALWATNGVTVPFNSSNVGMQFKPIVTVTRLSATTANLQITGHGLVLGDFVFVNEVVTTTGINFQTGYVTTVTDANNVIVTFPNATITTNGTGGIAQYLTNRSSTTKDCIRWYDGDPTDGNPDTPTLNGHKGWVNFCPPLSQNNFSIADLPLGKYYLVGAKMIINFKDRLLFIGPVVQTSTGSPTYLQDTIVYSQNGTPYYTVSYTNSPSATVDTPTSASITFNPILLPTNQTGTSAAFFGDSTGFGGWISAGIDQPINTVSRNQDVLILGFATSQVRLVYTGNDIIPFAFYQINSELGSSSTFSALTFDKGVISKGSRGYIITSQVDSERFDLKIPDAVFETKLTSNGNERVCAQRDYINEWIYFTYPSNQSRTTDFPSRTLFYNYRDQSWAMFNESYTTYGLFRRRTGETWATIGTIYPTWSSWNTPWNEGPSTLLNPQVIAGNQQGFVILRDSGTTNEATSLYIQSFTNSTVTSPDHGLNNGDYIIISDCIGTISTEVNDKIFSVYNVSSDTFDLSPNIATGTYLGGGLIKRMYIPFIQTKQFPTAWGLSRKTRIGVQQYLFTTTASAQVQLLIYLSQAGSTSSNKLPNGSIIYSTIVYTCIESANLGLTAFNTNLQMRAVIDSTGTDASSPSNQIWHRMNTSLIGDTVQVAITLNDDQMRDVNLSNQFAEIELHGIIMDVTSSQMLA